MTQKPHICCTWADTGHVQIWNFSSSLDALAESGTDRSRGGNSIHNQAPIMKFGGHKEEGYAIDWSLVVPGRLVSGDCKHCILLWEPSCETWVVDKNPFVGHPASVEDLQEETTPGNSAARLYETAPPLGVNPPDHRCPLAKTTVAGLTRNGGSSWPGQRHPPACRGL